MIRRCVQGFSAPVLSSASWIRQFPAVGFARQLSTMNEVVAPWAPDFVKGQIRKLPPPTRSTPYEIPSELKCHLGRKNYEAITGISTPEFFCRLASVLPVRERTAFWYLMPDFMQELSQWNKFPRGSDVFIKGLGTFDLGRACGDLLELRWDGTEHPYVDDHIPMPTECDVKSVMLGRVKPIRLRSACQCQVVKFPGAYGLNKDATLALAFLTDPDDMIDFLLYLDFDVDEFYHSLDEADFVLDNEYDLELSTMSIFHIFFWIVSPIELALFGHYRETFRGLPSAAALDTLDHFVRIFERDGPGRDHLIRYADWWRDPGHIARIDELDRYDEYVLSGEDDMSEAWKSLHPEILLGRIRSFYQAITRARFHDSADSATASHASYDWLQTLEDEPPLKVIRNEYQLEECAKDLSNCARIYSTQIASGKCILVSLEKEDETGRRKSVALGAYRRGIGWVQRYGYENAQLSEDILALFTEYGPKIEAWWQNLIAEQEKKQKKTRQLEIVAN